MTRLQKNGETSTFAKITYNLRVDQYHVSFATAHDSSRISGELRRIGELHLSPGALDILISELQKAKNDRLVAILK